jgi:hypothetical protein
MSDECDEITPIETINLSEFADPSFEVIRLTKAARGEVDRLERIKAEIRREEGRGWCRIYLMNDEIAVIEWFDQFVLTIVDTTDVAPLPKGV